MTGFADLYIEIRRSDSGFTANLRYDGAGSTASVHPLPNGDVPLALNPTTLLALSGEPLIYGQELSRQFFASSDLNGAFVQALAVAEVLQQTLHVRLYIDQSATELDTLHWETLALPGGGTLATYQRLFFSRYSPSPSWQSIKAPPTKNAMKALVVVSSPTNLDDEYDLAALDYAAESRAVRAALGKLPCVLLAAKGEATLARIVAEVKHGADLLYLIAHGALVDGEPELWL